jgi:hypothetical protein
MCHILLQRKTLLQCHFIIGASGFKSLCGNDIHNILVDYDGQICGGSKIEDEFDTSDSGSSHVDDIALGEVTVSETDIEAEDEKTDGFQ